MTDREWIADRQQDCEENAYACSLQIRVQIVEAAKLFRECASLLQVVSGGDAWAKGYVFGFASGWMQEVGISHSDQEGWTFLNLFYKGLQRSNVGIDPAAALASAIDLRGDAAFKTGRKEGDEEAQRFRRSHAKPVALTRHLATTTRACGNCGQKLRVPMGKTLDISCPKCFTKARITT